MPDTVKDIDTKNTPEPEVVQAVLDEVKKFEDNTKAIYDELRKNYEELKAELAKNSDDTLSLSISAWSLA